MNKRLQTEEIKTRCGKIIHGRGKCFVCGCKISKRGMVIHHIVYILGDIIYKNYKPRNDTNTLKYHTDLEPLIIEDPKRFMYLCNSCHTSLEKLLRFGDNKLNRLLKARRMTKTGKY